MRKGEKQVSKENAKKKGFAPFRWLRRMFFGASKELTVADERYDSPGKLAVKRFFRRPIATGAVILLAAMFLFVIIGPIIAPVNLTESGSEMLHTNIAPTMSMMRLPADMTAQSLSPLWHPLPQASALRAMFICGDTAIRILPTSKRML